MIQKIKVGIVGYGNLGKGVELGIQEQSDMELVAIFTRRPPQKIEPLFSEAVVTCTSKIVQYVNEIDVMILCGSSKNDLWEQTGEIAKYFPTVDSFDIHEEIPAYFKKVNEIANEHQTLSIISIGWDPGLFSLQRIYGDVLFPRGEVYTFWGEGLSQGHSTAIRSLPGVKDGVQYTIPSEKALRQIRQGEKLTLDENKRHERVCYVVLEKGVDSSEVERAIKTMPHYFAPYQTTVHFITEQELKENHQEMKHGGYVFARGNDNQLLEFSLTLSNNPKFTALVLIAYARAAYRLSRQEEFGARTLYDIPPGLLHSDPPVTLRRKWL